MIHKKQGWEVRLDALIMDYYYKPFVWGENDCFAFSHDVLKAVSGVDVIAPYRGNYNDAATAQALLDQYAGGKYEASFSDLQPVENVSFAQRGDIGIIEIDGKEYCGAVSMNGRSFLLRLEEGGVRALPLRAFKNKIRLWRAV